MPCGLLTALLAFSSSATACSGTRVATQVIENMNLTDAAASSYKTAQWVLSSIQRPYIGVLALPHYALPKSKFKTPFIQMSYERWVTASGGIAVPIPPDLSKPQVQELISGLNGFLFTGGPGKPTDFGEYLSTATMIYEHVMKSAGKGEWVPLWGTCLGFQAIAAVVAGGKDILDRFEGVGNVALPLEWAGMVRKESRLFGVEHARFEVAELFERSTTNNRHIFGISPATFDEMIKPSGFRAISSNVDKKGETFISTMEHMGAPIYAVQWHPEASLFNDNAWIERLPEDIEAAQWVGRFFISEARKNGRRPAESGKEKTPPLVEDLRKVRVGYWKEYFYVLGPRSVESQKITERAQQAHVEAGKMMAEASPNGAFMPGTLIQCTMPSVLRKRQETSSEVVVRLPAHSAAVVLGIGSPGRRIRIKAETGEQGWVNVVTDDNRVAWRAARVDAARATQLAPAGSRSTAPVERTRTGEDGDDSLESTESEEFSRESQDYGSKKKKNPLKRLWKALRNHAYDKAAAM